MHRESVGLKVKEGNGYDIHRESVGLTVEEVTDKIYTGKVWG